MADGKPISFLDASNLKNSSRKAELVTDNSYIPAVTVEGPEYDLYKTASGKYGEFNPLEISPAALLDKNQSRLDTWANGIAQFTSKAGTSFINAVGGLEVSSMNWLAQGVTRGGDWNASDFTMDPLTQGLHAFDQKITDMFPVYQDPAEAEQPWYNQLNTADFWAGNVLPNFGFTVGTAAGAYATGGIGLTGMALKGTKTASAIANAGKATSRAIGRALKTGEQGINELRALGASEDLARGINTISQQAYTGKGLIAKQVLGSGIAAVGEAKFEAVGTYEETYRDLIGKGVDEATADEYAKKAANVDFMLNLPVLTMSNFVQFGKLFSTGKTLKNPVANFIKGNYSQGFATKNLQSFISRKLVSAPKWLQKTAKVAGTLGTTFKNSAWEGFEEWAQYQGNKVAKNYSERIRTGWDSGMGAQMNGVIGIMSATGEELGGVVEDVASLDPARIFGGEGGENFMLGVLIGALGLPVNTKGDFAGGIIGAFQDSKKEDQRVSQRNAFATDVVNNLNAMREKYGKNKTLRDALVSQSFSADAIEALEKGDFSTFKAMEALGIAHDVLTAAEAGQGDLFTDILNSSDPIIASEVRDHVRQNLKEGQVDPLANLTDEEIESKVTENKENLKKNIALIKKINSYVSPLNGITPELSKQITGKLFLVKDIENRMADVIRGLDSTLDLIRPKDPEEAAIFNEQVNEFFNPNNIKETLANVASNKDVADFEANVLNKVTELMKKGVLDQNEASDMASALFDLSRNSKLRKDTLEQYSKIAAEPEKYNEWVEQKIAESSVDQELTKIVGKTITDEYRNAGIDVPENIFDVEEGKFYGKMGNQTVTITKEKGKEPVIKVKGEPVSAANFLAMTKLNEFTPLSQAKYDEFAAIKLEQKAKEEARILTVAKFEGVINKFRAEVEKYAKQIDKVKELRKGFQERLADRQQMIKEAKDELAALYKNKNKFKKGNIPVLEALLEDINKDIAFVEEQLQTLDTQEATLMELGDAVVAKVNALQQEMILFKSNDYELEERVNDLLEMAKEPFVQEAIDNLRAEKQLLQETKASLIETQKYLTSLFDMASTETDLQKYLDEIEEIDNTLNALDEELAALNSEIADLNKQLLKPEFVERAAILQTFINQIIEDAKYTQTEDKKPVGAEPIEETEIKVKFTDSAAKPITTGFFTTASSQTDTKDVDREDPRTVRWFKYINETPLKELKDNHKLLVFNKNSGIDEAKLGETPVDTQGEYLDNYVMITDKDGNPIEVNGLYVWSPLHKPDRDKSKFSYPKKEDGTSFTEEEKQEMYNQAQKKYIEFVNKVSTEKVLLPITNRSIGINKYKTGNTILAATGEDVKSLPLVVATSTKDRVVSVELVQQTVPNVPVGTVVTETQRGDYLVVNQNNLSQQDAEATYELIKRIVDGETKIDGKDLRAILENIIFVGKTKSPYSFFFYPNKDGEGKGGITMGGKSIAKDLMESQKEEIINFLKTKRYNVNKASLEKAQKSLNSNKPEPFFMPKLTEAGLDFEKYESYKHFLVDSSVRSLDSMPLTVYAPNLGEIGNKNKYLTFTEPKKETKKKGKTAPIGETVSIGEILGNEEEAPTEVAPQDKIAEYRAQEEEEVKKIIPNIEDYKVDGVINKDKVLEGIEERKKEELKQFGTSEKNTAKNNIKVLGVDEFVSRDLMELAYSNDSGNNPILGGGGQTLDKIIERGGYSKEELGKLLKTEINKIEAKYKAQTDAYNEIYDRYNKLITGAAKGTSTEVGTEEIISTTPEQLKKDVAALLNKALQELKEANATGKHFILGFHGGRTFDKADRTKQYTGEFRNFETRRIAESAGARYEGEMLFYTETIDEEDTFTYEQAVNGATGYAIKYGDDTPSIQAYLIPLNVANFTNRGLGEVGVTYDDIEADRIRKIGSVDFTRKIVTKNTTEAPVTALEKIQEQYYKDRKVSGYSKLNHATPEEFLKHLKTTAKGTDGKAKLAQVALEELQKLETKEELPSLEGVQALEDILPSVTVSEADRAEAVAGFDNFYGGSAGVSTPTLAEAKEAEEKCNGKVG